MLAACLSSALTMRTGQSLEREAVDINPWTSDFLTPDSLKKVVS